MDEFYEPGQYSDHSGSQIENLCPIPSYSASGVRIFQCPVCHRDFSTGTDCVRHIRIHTGEKPFMCFVSGCNYASRQKTSLRQHCVSVHKMTREKFNIIARDKFKSIQCS